MTYALHRYLWILAIPTGLWRLLVRSAGTGGQSGGHSLRVGAVRLDNRLRLLGREKANDRGQAQQVHRGSRRETRGGVGS